MTRIREGRREGVDAAPAPGPRDAGRLAALLAAHRDVAAAGFDPDRLAAIVAERAAALTGADGAAVEMLDGDDIVYRAATGLAAPHLGLRLRADASLSGRAARTNALLVSEDAETDPRVDRAATRKLGLRSMVVAPLAKGGVPVGALKVLSARPRAFTQDDARTLEVLASLLSAALAHASEHEDRARESAISSLLAAVAEQANASRSFVETMRFAVDRVTELTGWPVGHVLTVEPDGTLRSTGLWHVDDPERYASFVRASGDLVFRSGKGLPGHVHAEARPTWLQNISDSPIFLRAVEAEAVGLRTAFAFPILVEREPVAVLEFFSPHPTPPTPRVLEALGHIGAMLGRVAERERNRAALRESERRLRDLLAGLPVAVFVVDVEGRPIFTNREAERILGRGAEPDARPPDFSVLYRVYVAGTDDLYPTERLPVVRAMAGERDVTVDDVEIRLDGRVVPLEVWADPIFDENGRIAFAVAAFRDVTDRRVMERRLAEREAELTRSNAELEQFAYVASHDLQEPLRMVSSYVTLLARRYEGRLDKDADDFIRFAVDGAQRMQGLVNDLLRYSRVGGGPLAREATSLDEILGRALANLAVAIEESGAVVTRDPLPVAFVDGALVAQVFQNLVGNALKFRGIDPPRVHVSARRVEGAWEVAVADNGIGLDPRHAHRIFQIFQRLHARDAYPGTGIGLAITKKIVERHGGRIRVESEPGSGATFLFTLPFKEESLDVDDGR